MESFWKVSGLLVITVILGLAIGKTEKDFSVLLTMMGCCIAMMAAVSYLKPVFDLLWELCAIGDIQDGVMGVLLKAVGIALISELAGTICADAGNSSLGKTIQLLGFAAILYLSVPIFDTLLSMIQEILSEL